MIGYRVELECKSGRSAGLVLGRLPPDSIFPTSFDRNGTAPTPSLIDIFQGPCTKDAVVSEPSEADVVVQNGKHLQRQRRTSPRRIESFTRLILHSLLPVGTQGSNADQDAGVH